MRTKIFLLIVPLLAGCGIFTPTREQVPIAEFGLTLPNGGKIAWKNPKDTKASNVVINTTKDSFNMSIGEIGSVMNPDIITTTGDAQAKQITAIANGMSQMVTTAAAAVATGGAAPAAKSVFSVPPPSTLK